MRGAVRRRRCRSVDSFPFDGRRFSEREVDAETSPAMDHPAWCVLDEGYREPTKAHDAAVCLPIHGGCERFTFLSNLRHSVSLHSTCPEPCGLQSPRERCERGKVQLSETRMVAQWLATMWFRSSEMVHEVVSMHRAACRSVVSDTPRSESVSNVRSSRTLTSQMQRAVRLAHQTLLTRTDATEFSPGMRGACAGVELICQVGKRHKSGNLEN